MSEYSCFLHPREKGDNLTDSCPICQERFDFPLRNAPSSLNGRKIVGSLSRGFYGAVFVTEHPRFPRKFAVKVVPKKAYAPQDEGGYGKDFDREVQLHSELSDIDLVASLLDAGDEDVTFGAHVVPCHWLEMEYVDGPTLDDKIQGSPTSPREIAQIAWDLLDLIDALQQRGGFHNDLHGRNILIATLDESHARRHAIHPHVQAKALDLGSADSKSQSGPTRLGDVHWVAQHILSLLQSYEEANAPLPPEAMRLTAKLRQVAVFCSGTDPYRRPKPSDMKSAIRGAYSSGVTPWSQATHLESISAHYNAQSLPPWFASDLFFDPDGRWQRRLTAPGPLLLVGMRGCGKTVLLRSVEWTARLHPREQEDHDDVLGRVQADQFLALFVSCASLQPSPRSSALVLPLRRLFLAFAREVTRNVQACELQEVGEVDYSALGKFNELLKSFAPWYECPDNATDAVTIEQAISEAFESRLLDMARLCDLNASVAFDRLAVAARGLVDVWTGKKLLFMLDDVSQRYLPLENVDGLVSQLCFQSPEFSFKISTESQTLSLVTPGERPARGGRDYEVFDLGREVAAKLRSRGGASFIVSFRQA